MVRHKYAHFLLLVLVLLGCRVQEFTAARTLLKIRAPESIADGKTKTGEERKQDKESKKEKGERLSWSDAIHTLRDSLSNTEDALDLIGLTGMKSSVEHLVTVLMIMEGQLHISGEEDGDDSDSDTWQADVEEHQEAYTEAFEELSKAIGENSSDDHLVVAAKVVPVLEDQLLTLPYEDMKKKVEAFTDAVATLSNLRALCTGYGGDASENVYARLWRLAETCLRPSRRMPRKAFRSLMKSVYEAIIETQAKSAEATMVHALCPAAANAARAMLVAVHAGEEEKDMYERVAFLLSVLNSPAAPEKCGEIYREPDDDVSSVCICEPGQCTSKPKPVKEDPEEDSEDHHSEKWICAACASQKCSLPWQQEQCEDNTGCDADTSPVPVVLGSKISTQMLLRHGLYLDPNCKGVIDCLRRTFGEARWRRFKGVGQTILAVRKDWLAVSALATVGSKLLSYLPSAGSSLLERNASTVLDQLSSAIDGEQVKQFVGLLKPALLAYLWVRFRVQSVRERASAHGFCRRAARELSSMAQAQRETDFDENSSSSEARATELSEVIAASLPDSGDERKEQEHASEIRPLLLRAMSATPSGSYHRFNHVGLGLYPAFGMPPLWSMRTGQYNPDVSVEAFEDID